MRRVGPASSVVITLIAICCGAVALSSAQTIIEPPTPWPGPPTGRMVGPTADEIIKSLTPTGQTGTTRHIRIGPATASQAALPGTAPAISLTVQFASGSAALTPQALQTLNSVGKALTAPSLAIYRFRITGYTDTVGTREYNKRLSDRRAAAVADYLTNKFQIDRSRIQTIGMGKDGLLIPTPDQTPEPRNRRISIVNIGS